MQHYAFMLRASLSSLTDYMTPCHVGRKLGKEQHVGILELRRRGLKAGGGILLWRLLVTFLLGSSAKHFKVRELVKQTYMCHMHYWKISCFWAFFHKWKEYLYTEKLKLLLKSRQLQLRMLELLAAYNAAYLCETQTVWSYLHFIKNFFTRQSRHPTSMNHERLMDTLKNRTKIWFN